MRQFVVTKCSSREVVGRVLAKDARAALDEIAKAHGHHDFAGLAATLELHPEAARRLFDVAPERRGMRA